MKTSQSKIIHKELSYRVTGLLYAVHNELGRFRNEKQYGDAFERKLKDEDIAYKREARILPSFEGEHEGRNVADFIINNQLVVELKAKQIISKEDYYQVKRYLESLGLELGILINFRRRFLAPKRILASADHSEYSDVIRRLGLRRGGFTILEIIIYILIFAIVGTLGTSVLSFALKAKNANSRLNEVAINMGRALSQMVEKVHQSLTINGASSSLNLAMSSSTLNPTVFSLSSGAITITEGASAAVSTTPSTIIITSLSFTQITNPAPSTSSVQIQMTGAYNNLGSADTSTIYSLQTTAMPL